jgi:hypothetical protein
MTKKEMIKDLSRIMDLFDMYIDLNQSLNITQMEVAYLTIKCIVRALEQQPCGDCISRAKALEMLGDEPENWTDTEKEIQEVNDYRWFKSILEELPSVTPSIPDLENNYNIGYNCGYADAMIDIAEGE